MTEKQTKITQNTLIPLSLVISICLGIWSVATMNKQISVNETNIMEIKTECGSNPSRQEFDGMREDIREMKDDIKTLLTK